MALFGAFKGRDMDVQAERDANLTFLYGIKVRKDLLIRGIKTVKNKFLMTEYRAMYYAFQITYAETKTHIDSAEMFDRIVDTIDRIQNKQEIKDQFLDVFMIGKFSEEMFEHSIHTILEGYKQRITEDFKKGLLRTKTVSEVEKKIVDYKHELEHAGDDGAPKTMAQMSTTLLDEYEDEDYYTYSTSIESLDAVLGGLQKGQFYLVAGYTNDGKTILTKQMIWKSILAGHKILWVQLEGTERETREMFACSLAHEIGCGTITSEKIRTRSIPKEYWEKYIEIKDYMAKMDNFVLIRPRKKYTITDLENDIDRMKQGKGIEIVVVDYLELLYAENNDDYRLRMKQLAMRAENISTTRDVCFISPWQINRDGRANAEKRAKKKRKGEPPVEKHYKTYDLQESSALEQCAKAVIWVYSDDDLREQQQIRIGISKAKVSDNPLETGFICRTDFNHCRIYQNEHDNVGIPF